MANIYRIDKDGNLVLVQKDTDNQVATNTSDIASLKSRVDALETIVPDNYTTLESKITTNANGVSTNKKAIDALTQTVTQNDYQVNLRIDNEISPINTSVTSLKNRVSVLEASSNYITAYEGGLNG